MMQVIQVLEGQTIFDIALTYYGSVEGVLWIKKDNPDFVLDGDISGLSLKIRTKSVIKQNIVDFFDNQTLITY